MNIYIFNIVKVTGSGSDDVGYREPGKEENDREKRVIKREEKNTQIFVGIGGESSFLFFSLTVSLYLQADRFIFLSFSPQIIILFKYSPVKIDRKREGKKKRGS